MVVKTYEEIRDWLTDGGSQQPHLLLGNGFSIAYDPARFTYGALAAQAEAEGRLPETAMRVMTAIGTPDFEAALRKMEAAAETLEAIDAIAHAAIITGLRTDIDALREALAQSVAGIHPDRPYEIGDDAYARVRDFIDSHKGIYTVNYDLLLYWSLMQDLSGKTNRRADDGFRDSGIEGDDTVLWDIYDPFKQSVHYLHGALHLFVGADGLRKITYSRTDEPLIDQVRRQLRARRFPLYVAEGDSRSKLERINASAYLSRSLRSLSSCGGGMLVYGHSLDPNDHHVFEAVVRSNITKVAFSLYGDPSNDTNQQIQQRARDLTARRSNRSRKTKLHVTFFDAESVPLWHR